MQRALTQLRLDLGAMAVPMLRFHQVSSLNAALGCPVPDQGFAIGSNGRLVSSKLKDSQVQCYLESAWRIKRADGTQGPNGPLMSIVANNDWQRYVLVRTICLFSQITDSSK